MSTAALIAVVAVGLGLALFVAGLLSRVKAREQALAEILDLPFGERDVEVEALSESEGYSPIVEGTIDLAGRVVDQFDSKGMLSDSLERARLPIRPGEYLVITVAGTVALAAIVYGITAAWFFGLAAAVIGPLVAAGVVRRRISKRRRAFEEQLPDALTLIASSLSAGHTFLRAIQMMCEEQEPPLAEEFSRLVSETRLGDPVADALARMAHRLQIRDLDWVVQSIRIQQTVGGKLADILHTLAEFIRARQEVRREVQVLTAEGRISAYVLAALAPLIMVAVQVTNPDYLQPMYHGWGLAVLLGTAGLMALGTFIIFRMIKIEV
ncbi:MAG TPA: type II secretion system F family protein [Acidimicrobiales bacterium]|nr:type II secretion system F family protein [Acidimicrobiales bacterium]